MPNRNSEEGSYYDISPEDICPAGGIHDYRNTLTYYFAFWDKLLFVRNQGEKRCLKCKQTENQAKMSVALEDYEQPSSTNTRDTNPSNVPSMPQPPAYAQTREEMRK
ncbi:11188_t:CDS:2 [Paraglomus occultum]|uniref:11188_t:CDS:1 n=1 Tax=Paraglomus occultum TaxID=144539 RepID=A0A9N9ACW1_9GLOM|nr:11188_t:CDS:2 [Paraglomus occultum]